MPFFSPSCFRGYSDSPGGFYSVYSEVRATAESAHHARAQATIVDGRAVICSRSCLSVPASSSADTVLASDAALTLSCAHSLALT
jgi:hypothetical protein